MVERTAVPDATLYRLALYHCYVEDVVASDGADKVTSRKLAGALGLKEETVRRDISFVGDIGRPGAGYSARKMLVELADFLGIKKDYPIIRVGTVEMLEALDVVYPTLSTGVMPVAYFSEKLEDAGKVVDGLTVRHITDIPKVIPNLDAQVAVIATSREWVQITVDLLAAAGVGGLLVITPTVAVDAPDGVAVTQLRMPCDIKSLACRCKAPIPEACLD